MPKELESLISVFQALPGVGPKAATRMVLSLLERKELAGELSSRVEECVRDIGFCAQCGNLSKNNHLCYICTDPKRDKNQMAVVSSVTDLMAIERAGIFSGLYFVFDKPNAIYDDQETFNSYVTRMNSHILKNYTTELILALPSSIDTEVLCSVLSEKIREALPEVRISRIALGMPTGADFDYTDKLTITKSFKGRTLFS